MLSGDGTHEGTEMQYRLTNQGMLHEYGVLVYHDSEDATVVLSLFDNNTGYLVARDWSRTREVPKH